MSNAELFALKEAVMKALGRGLGRIAFTEIALQRRGTDLLLELTGRAATRAVDVGAHRWELRTGHRGPLVLAEAVALGDSRAGS